MRIVAWGKWLSVYSVKFGKDSLEFMMASVQIAGLETLLTYYTTNILG